jgi:hypothetical protein
MTRREKQAMLGRQESIRNALEFLKKRPGFAHAQAQSMRRQIDWESGLSEQEKQLASYERLLAVLRLIDIRAGVYLPLIDDIPSQDAHVTNGIMEQAWEDYVGFSVYFAPPMREDPNYEMITDRGRHWIAASYDRADTTEDVANQPSATSAETSESATVFISYSWDDEAHKEWALGLANRLRDDGIDAIIDQTHLNLGGDTPEFMEKSIREQPVRSHHMHRAVQGALRRPQRWCWLRRPHHDSTDSQERRSEQIHSASPAWELGELDAHRLGRPFRSEFK